MTNKTIALGLRGTDDDNQIRTVQVLGLMPERSIVEPIKAGHDIFRSLVFKEAQSGNIYRITIETDDKNVIFQDDN